MLDAGFWSGSEQIGAGQGQPGRLCSWFQVFNSSIFQISLMASHRKKETLNTSTQRTFPRLELGSCAVR